MSFHGQGLVGVNLRSSAYLMARSSGGKPSDRIQDIISLPSSSTMTKTLAVFGATGRQGSSVINNVLADPELSQIFNVRAITRDADSDKAKKLKAMGVEVVSGDANDPASLDTALRDVHTVFAMTAPAFGPDAFEVQFNSVKNIADAAVAQGVEYIIFSTLPSIVDISGGKYKAVIPFDAKAKGEEYIRTLPIKSAFVSLGYFMDNFQSQPFLAPRPSDDGSWVMVRHTSPNEVLPFIDAHADTGKFVTAILAEPDKFNGKRVCAAASLHTIEEVAAILAKTTGKKIVFKVVSEEEMRATLPDFAADIFIDAFNYGNEYGYFGPGTAELVAEGAKLARGRLTTFEEYQEKHPLQLEDTLAGTWRPGGE
ncbi:hypothetical protein B0T16DRAFT_409526 [Cercophora newfieldiana]|uniref:NmrA-like domain-containing protein n=1 Tax=Cercophora newfieldiana TaxID=92897 RepID=A0AA39YAQ5_9PEZI|nr:hypothetical protein B0T16DRAFT_409526 [Cercophora newfieldiana]